MNKKSKPSIREETQETFDRMSKLSSATDCTGLIPGGVMSESQTESYGELYDIPPQKPQHKEDK